MIVVSDTSPITNLLQINQLGLLQKLFTTVIISEEVYTELSQLDFQAKTIKTLDWIIISQPTNQKLIRDLEKSIDSGEASSIALALELNADFLLIDEQKGRIEAEKLGIKITGIIGVLIRAKTERHIPMVKPVLDELIAVTKFRIHPLLYAKALEMTGENTPV